MIYIKIKSATGDVISVNYEAEDICAVESKKTIVERLANLKSQRYSPQCRSANVIPYRHVQMQRKPLRETAYYYDDGNWYRDYDYLVEYNKSGMMTHEQQTAYNPDMSVKAAIDGTYELNENGFPITETYNVSEDGVNWRKWGLIKNHYDKRRIDAILNRETYGWNSMRDSWQYIPSSYLYHLTQVVYDDYGRIVTNILWYGSEKDGMATDRITYIYDEDGVIERIVWECLTPSDIIRMEAYDIEWHHTNGNYITYGNDIYDIFDDDITNNAPLAYSVTEYDSNGNAVKRKGRVTYQYDEEGRMIQKKTITGEHRRIFIDTLVYDLDDNGSYSEEHIYGTDNNGDGMIGCDGIEDYSKTERFFNENGNIVLKNEYVLDDDSPFLDFSTCHTYKDSAPRIDKSTRHTYKYGSNGEILEENIDVKPYGASEYKPKSRYEYFEFTDIAQTLPPAGLQSSSSLVTYRNDNLFFNDYEGSAFTIVDTHDRICMKGSAPQELSVKNLSAGMYKLTINGLVVRFYKK